MNFNNNDLNDLFEDKRPAYFSASIWFSSMRMMLVFSGVYISLLVFIIGIKASTGRQFAFDLNTPVLLTALAIGKWYLSKIQRRFVRIDEFVVSSIGSSIIVIAVQLIPVFIYFDVSTIPFRSLLGVFLIVLTHILIVIFVLFPWRRFFSGCLFDK